MTVRRLLIVLLLSGCSNIKSGYVTLKTESDSGDYMVFIQQGKRESFCMVSYYKYLNVNKNEWMECEDE